MDKSRQQFEAWFKKEYPLIESQPENTLLQSVKRQCLKAWQASRESLEVELPVTSIFEIGSAYDSGYHNGVKECKEILIRNGVKIK
ncbi:hypothetical protein M2263_001750 [Providencia alcalifaciens]|nr:hypothetical protein [Providencia alcalifaciens]